MLAVVTTYGGIMQAVYSFKAPAIGRVFGDGVAVSSIWTNRWKPSRRREFWRRVWDGDFLNRRVRRRTTRGFRMAMCMALLGVLVASALYHVNASVSLRMGTVDTNPVWTPEETLVVVEGFTDLPAWTDRPINTDEWSAITVTNDKIASAVFNGTVQQFLEDRSDLADIRLILEQANARVPHAVSMSLADMSESIGASLRMGLNRDEVGALARLASEFIMSIVPTEGTYE